MLEIASSSPGRLRVRHPAFRNTSDVVERARQLSRLPGVGQVEPNFTVGSILVTYDASRLHEAEILGSLGLPAPPPPEPDGPGETVAQGGLRPHLLNAGLLGTLGLTVAGAALGRRTLHVTAGILFLVAVGAHLLVGRGGQTQSQC